MPDSLLHALAIPENARTESQSDRQRRLAKTGQLGDGQGLAESVSLQPGERLLTGAFTGKFADIQRAEVEELFSASAIETVPFAARDVTSSDDAYYALENITLTQPDPATQDFARFDGRITKEGTRQNHWRAVRTKPQDISGRNPFASDDNAQFGVPRDANKVEWYDPPADAYADAADVGIAVGEHGIIETYDALDAPFDDPVLTYSIPYTDEWPTDCRLWDTYNRPKVYRETAVTGARVGEATVGDSVVAGTQSRSVVDSQWQRVYVNDHEWVGDAVYENDFLRLRITKPGDDLSVQRYQPSTGGYEAVSLNKSSSSWRLYDSRPAHIGQVRIDIDCVFRDTGGSGRHRVTITLLRGDDEALIISPPNETMPAGLQTLLFPIAKESNYAPRPQMGLVEK